MERSEITGTADDPPGMVASGADAGRRPLLANPLPLFGFFTRVPIGTQASLDQVVAAFPLVPVVGWVTGAAGLAVAAGLAGIVPALPLAVVVLAVVVGLTGLNQMDGLLDLGDGLMVHGDAERRLRAMHDYTAGVGAVGAVLVTYLLTFACLAALAGRGRWFFAAGVLAAEVLCRLPYLVLGWFARPSHEGLGRTFLLGFGPAQAAVGVVVCLPVLATAYWFGFPVVLGAAAAAVLVALVLLRVANRLLGGVGGDVLGASQEISRAIVLLVLTVALSR
jgi:adenosylcobinamide-GDP ribazoletransferase